MNAVTQVTVKAQSAAPVTDPPHEQADPGPRDKVEIGSAYVDVKAIPPVVFGNAAAPVSGYLSVEGSSDPLGYLFSSLPTLPAGRVSNSTSNEPPPAAHGKTPKAGPSSPGWLQAMETSEAESNEVQKSLARMFADRKKMEMEISQMYRDLQTYFYTCVESSLLNQARARSKVHDGWLKYING